MRIHPLAIVTLGCLVWAFLACMRLAPAVSAEYIIASALLTSPVALLLWAHLRLARHWLQHVWLALCAPVLAYACFLATLLTVWMRMGWFGVGLFTVILGAFAGLALVALRCRRLGSA